MRMVLKLILLSFIFFSCDAKKNDESILNSIPVQSSVLDKTSIEEVSKAPDCITRLIDIVQSNTECAKLIGNMKIQQVNYAFQIDTLRYLSDTSALDTLTSYTLILVESHSTHNRNAAFFKFDTSSNKLYILDVISADYIETDCNLKLIDIYKQKCQY